MKHFLTIVFTYTTTYILAQTFTLYKPDPTNTSWTENDLRGLCFDKNSEKIWALSYDKLKEFDGVNWINYPDFLISPVSYFYGKTMQIAANGNLWIATSGQGVVIFNGTTFTELNTSNSGIPNNFTTCLAIDESEKAYIGATNVYNAFASLNGTNWNTNWPSPDITGTVNDVEIDTTNDIVWVATSTSLYKLQGNSLQKYDYGNFPVIYANINCLELDQNNNPWLGTDEGLWKFDGTNWTTYTTTNSNIPSQYVNDLVIKNGILWLATGGTQALVKFDQINWTIYTPQNSLIQSTNIRKMVFDNDGNLWLATDTGLIKANATITGINTINTTDLLTVSPSPASDKLVVRVDKTEASTIQIIDALGKVVKQVSINELTTEINVVDLENGIYFLKLNNASGSYTKKITISK